jgi:hypothetical protein
MKTMNKSFYGLFLCLLMQPSVIVPGSTPALKSPTITRAPGPLIPPGTVVVGPTTPPNPLLGTCLVFLVACVTCAVVLYIQSQKKAPTLTKEIEKPYTEKSDPFKKLNPQEILSDLK